MDVSTDQKKDALEYQNEVQCNGVSIWSIDTTDNVLEHWLEIKHHYVTIGRIKWIESSDFICISLPSKMHFSLSIGSKMHWIITHVKHIRECIYKWIGSKMR